MAFAGERKNIFSFCQQVNLCYRLSAGRLLMASSFNLSTARVYFSVCFKPLWPRRLATVLIFAPLLRMFTAKEWRAQCQLPALGTDKNANNLEIKSLAFLFYEFWRLLLQLFPRFSPFFGLIV